MGKNKFKWEFDCIEDALRKLKFIREGFYHLDEDEEGMYGEMIEGVLPGIIENFEGGYSELKKKLSQIPS